MSCPLCDTPDTTPFAEDKHRPYKHCPSCSLVFVPQSHHISEDDEHERYRQHQNSPDDLGYRSFLRRIAEPVLERVSPDARGIDMGCGPSPVLAGMLREEGIAMQVWDPYFFADPAPLHQSYDLVICTEVVEHFRSPKAGWESLFARVATGGLLAVMTQTWSSQEAFAGWHYKNDKTHVAFHHNQTMQWVANHWGASLESPATSVFLFSGMSTKPDNSGGTA